VRGVTWFHGALGWEDGEDALVPAGHLFVRRVPTDDGWRWNWVVRWNGRMDSGKGLGSADEAKAAAEAALARLQGRRG
jgi:hypothetical protein